VCSVIPFITGFITDQCLAETSCAEATLTTTCARFFTGLVLSAAAIFGAPSASGAQPLGPVRSETAPNGFPAARLLAPLIRKRCVSSNLSSSSKSPAAWRYGTRCCWPMSAITKPSWRRAADVSSSLRPGESRCRCGEFPNSNANAGRDWPDVLVWWVAAPSISLSNSSEAFG